MDYRFIQIETDEENGVGILTLHRPDQLNAVNAAMMDEVTHALAGFEANDEIGCIILTGSKKAFASGADITEMKSLTYADAYAENFITAGWEAVTRCRKPVIAAVSGYALGFGCELAMMCDFILAADNARFGQPEVTLGITPGAGGTQRLTRFVGKSKAMEMILTGRVMKADEAERAGLVARVVAADELMEEARKVARKIAAYSRPAVMLNKELVNAAHETMLAQGVTFERRIFHSLFSTEDQKEGMEAFIDKRTPHFKNR